MASRWTVRQAVVTGKYKDGTSITWGPGEGTLTIGGMNAENAEQTPVLDRGGFDGFVKGPDLVQDVSIELTLINETLTDPALKRITDFYLHTGSFAAAPSVDDTVTAWTVDIQFTDGTTSSNILLPVVRGEFSFGEDAAGDTLSFSGTNHRAPVFS